MIVRLLILFFYGQVQLWAEPVQAQQQAQSSPKITRHSPDIPLPCFTRPACEPIAIEF